MGYNPLGLEYRRTIGLPITELAISAVGRFTPSPHLLSRRMPHKVVAVPLLFSGWAMVKTVLSNVLLGQNCVLG